MNMDMPLLAMAVERISAGLSAFLLFAAFIISKLPSLTLAYVALQAGLCLILLETPKNKPFFEAAHTVFDPRHEKTRYLHMRKQRRGSASRLPRS